jgi:putative chitinase
MITQLTKNNLKNCMPQATDKNIDKFFDPLWAAMQKYEINTALRMAHFLAQLAHESGSLRYVEELASGEAYEGRKDLGNTQPGDGKRFKGRGLIQITGRYNYEDVGKALGYDFINHPEDLEKPGAASYSAAWFWHDRELNKFADIDAFRTITKKINGGFNGLQDRLDHLNRCKKALHYPLDSELRQDYGTSNQPT